MQTSELLRLGYDLLREHGLTDWDCSISDLTSPSGACLFTGSCEHSLKLILIDKTLSDGACFQNVFLHEIAHALLPEGEEEHGHKWAAKALEIGVSTENVKAHCPTYFEGTK